MRMLRLLVVLLVLAALGGAAWTLRDRIPGPWQRQETTSTVVSEATAEAAEAKLRGLYAEGGEVELTGAEATSLLRYRLASRLPDALVEPTVEFLGADSVRVTGRIPTDQLPAVRELTAARAFLPDTADVAVSGTLRDLDGREVAVRVEKVTFAGVGVPRSVYPEALTRLGRPEHPGVGADEYPFPLPPGVQGARVVDGRLVLSAPVAP